jgi:hypothetical protein
MEKSQYLQRIEARSAFGFELDLKASSYTLRDDYLRMGIFN